MRLHDEFTPRGIFAPMGKFDPRGKLMHINGALLYIKDRVKCHVSPRNSS